MSEHRVEPAGETDLDAIVALERESLGQDAWTAPLIREGVEGRLPTVHYLVARADGDLAGYAVVSLAGDIAELQRIAVAAAHRRTGVARSLIDALLEEAATTEADRAGTVVVTLRPTRAGMKELRKTGELRVRAKFTFTPCGGAGSRVVHRYTLRLR